MYIHTCYNKFTLPLHSETCKNNRHIDIPFTFDWENAIQHFRQVWQQCIMVSIAGRLSHNHKISHVSHYELYQANEDNSYSNLIKYAHRSRATFQYRSGLQGTGNPMINDLPPACWSTFWKSNFKQQLGCRVDIMDNKSFFLCFDTCNYVCLDTSDQIFRFYLLKYSLFFQILLY